MCLVLPPSQKYRKIAQKDIECYKGYNISNIGMIVSPIRHMEVCPISEIKDRTVTAYGYEGVRADKDDFAIVSSGFIHCCLKGTPPGDAVFKVIIPKGTEYYENDHDYCSTQIKIVGYYKHHGLTSHKIWEAFDMYPIRRRLDKIASKFEEWCLDIFN